MKNILFVGVVIGIVFASPLAGYAQTCFQGKPLPNCKSFWITEITVGIDVISSYAGGLVTPEVGLMANLNKKHAIGGTAFLDITDNAGFGVKGRYRYWMSKNFSIDAGAGGKISDTWTVLADGSLVYGGWIGIGGRVEHWGGHNGETALFATAKVGGWPAVGTVGVAAVVAAVLVAIAWVSIAGAG